MISKRPRSGDRRSESKPIGVHRGAAAKQVCPSDTDRPPLAHSRLLVLASSTAIGLCQTHVAFLGDNASMKPLAIHHVAINVSNLDEALEFYEGVLGFVARADRPEFGFPGAWLDAGNEQLHLIEAEAPPNVGQHFAVRVEDLDAVIAELRAGGLRPSDPSPVGSSRQAFISDPSGNVVELHEVG